MSDRDWSSDVCSSDLVDRICLACRSAMWRKRRRPGDRVTRSEERRVGKECRSRAWRDDEKQKTRRSRDIAQLQHLALDVCTNCATWQEVCSAYASGRD